LNIPGTGVLPTTLAPGDLWLLTGDTHLQFRDANNATQKIAFLSDIVSTLTAGTGINITGNAINNTGVLSFNTRTGIVVPAANDYSFSQISGTVASAQLSGTYGISITGNAATATSATTAVTVTGNVPGAQITGNIAGNAANVTGTVAVANGGTGVASAAQNTLFAGPTGAAGAPAFRALASSDIPVAQRTRAICYIAGGDSGAGLGTTDSQKSFFNNVIGAATVTAATCQVDSGTAQIQIFKNNTATNVTASVSCTAIPGTWQNVGLGTTALAAGDSLDLAITLTPTAKRVTICLAATVN
jgi:hypothetical protein